MFLSMLIFWVSSDLFQSGEREVIAWNHHNIQDE